MPRYIVELLGNVLAEVARRAAALRTAGVVGLMNSNRPTTTVLDGVLISSS